MNKVKELLELLGKGQGGTDICVCPKCKYEEPHERGKPCNIKNCPKCDTPMTGKGAPGEIEKEK